MAAPLEGVESIFSIQACNRARNTYIHFIDFGRTIGPFRLWHCQAHVQTLFPKHRRTEHGTALLRDLKLTCTHAYAKDTPMNTGTVNSTTIKKASASSNRTTAARTCSSMPPLLSAPACAACRRPEGCLRHGGRSPLRQDRRQQHRDGIKPVSSVQDLSALSHRGRSPWGAAFCLHAWCCHCAVPHWRTKHASQVQDPTDGAPCPCADF